MPSSPNDMTARRYTRRQIAGLAALIGAAGAATVVIRQSTALGVDIGHRPIVKRVHSDSLSPQIKPENADVTLSVFTDYRCPVCRKSDAAMMAVVARDGRVRIVFKEWPIFGELSQRAAIVALMADRQQLYKPIHRALLEVESLNDETFERLIMREEGHWDPIKAELADPTAQTIEPMQIARNDAFALGLSGTPGYLIGPILVKGALSQGELESVLSLARKASANSI